MLAVDQTAIQFHVEDATFSLYQFTVNALGVFNGGRQTGGLRRVVSHYAISDSDFHFFQPLCGDGQLQRKQLDERRLSDG